VSAGLVAAEVIEWGGLVALMGAITLTLLALACLPSALLTSSGTATQTQSNHQSSSTLTQVSPTETDRAKSRIHHHIHTLLQSRLLLVTALATLMMALTTNLIDYLFKAEVQRALSADKIGPFLARFHAVTNAFILWIQLFILGKLSERIGLKWSFPLYPISLISISALCLTPLGWFTFVILRGVDTLMKFTIHSNTENLVLTPIPLVLRTQVKVLLKGAIYPLGGLIAGLMIWLIAAISDLFSLDPISCALLITIILCLAWIMTTLRVHVYYWQQLASNLQLPSGPNQRKPKHEGLMSLQNALSSRTRAHDHEEESFDTCLHNQELIDLIIEIYGLESYRTEVNQAWQGDDKERADLIAWVGLSASWQGARELGQLLERYVLDELESNRSASPSPTSTSE